MLRTALPVALALALTLGACMQPDHPQADAQEPAAHEARLTIGSIRWFVDLDAALAEARRVDKPLWVHFGEHPG